MLVISGAFAWAAYREFTGVLVESSAERLRNSAELLATSIADGVPATRDQLDIVARSAGVRRLLARSSSPDRAYDSAAIVDLLPPSADSSRLNYRLLDLTGRSRIRIAVVDAPLAPGWAEAAALDGRLSPTTLTFSPMLDAGGLARYEIATPVHARDEGESLVGYLVETRAVRGRGAGAIRRLTGSSTLLIGQPGTETWSDLERIVPGPPPIARLDTAIFFDDSPRGAGIGVARAVRGTPWVVWLQLSRQQVLAPIGSFVRRIVPVALLLALAGALVTWSATRRITRRITRLTTEVDAIDRPAEAPGTAVTSSDARAGDRDEVERLETAFRNMAGRVERQQQIEAQVMQSQKLEAVGRLAGGLAHDFNNVLTVVSNYGEMVAAELPPESVAARDMEQILHAAERAARLTRQLLAFSRRQVLQPVSLDLNEVVRSAHTMLQRLLPSRVEVRHELAQGLAPVLADPGQVEQVLLNLALNASDAMPDGGRLTFHTTMLELDDLPESTGELPTTARRHVCLIVKDTGHGMDRETVARAFEPFFTTKPLGKGTGLGLASVHGIVTQLGGRIWLYSEPGAGTTIKIYLPVTEAPATALPERAPRLPTRRGAGTILLVEDDPATRLVTARILSAQGFVIVEALHGAQALDRLTLEGLTPRLVLSDVMMPGINGVELSARIAERWPRLPVMLMSGYSDTDLPQSDGPGRRRTLLEKPFTAASLVTAVWATIDAA